MEKKNVLGKLNVFDIILFSASIITIICCSVFSPSFSILSIATSTIGIIYVFFISKKLLIGQFLAPIYLILYITVSYQQNFFGEALTNLCLILPIDIITLFVWLKNKNKEDSSTINTNKISKQETFILIACSGAMFVGAYFLLRALNTNQLIINTINLVLTTAAGYLKIRRVPLFPLIYIATSFICLTLWIIATITSGLSNLPLVINFTVLSILNIYSFFNWNKKNTNSKPTKQD